MFNNLHARTLLYYCILASEKIRREQHYRKALLNSFHLSKTVQGLSLKDWEKS